MFLPLTIKGSFLFQLITFTSLSWARLHASMHASTGFALMSQIRMLLSTEQLARTFGSFGDHCKSSTELECPTSGRWSTSHVASVGVQMWMSFLQSPVAKTCERLNWSRCSGLWAAATDPRPSFTPIHGKTFGFMSGECESRFYGAWAVVLVVLREELVGLHGPQLRRQVPNVHFPQLAPRGCQDCFLHHCALKTPHFTPNPSS